MAVFIELLRNELDQLVYEPDEGEYIFRWVVVVQLLEEIALEESVSENGTGE